MRGFGKGGGLVGWLVLLPCFRGVESPVLPFHVVSCVNREEGLGMCRVYMLCMYA